MPQGAVSVSDDCILVSGEQVAANLQVTLAPGCLSMTAGSDQNCFVSVWIWSTLIYVIDQSVKWTRTGCLWMTVGSDLDYSVWDGGLKVHWAIYIVQYTSIAPIHPQDAFQWQVPMIRPKLHSVQQALYYSLNYSVTFLTGSLEKFLFTGFPPIIKQEQIEKKSPTDKVGSFVCFETWPRVDCAKVKVTN